MYEFIYLLQTRESLKNNENIFKIGRTCRLELGRFNDYPNGSILHFHMPCINSTDIERELIKIFNKQFQNIHDYGKEYFEGNLLDMIDIISKKVSLSYYNLSTSFNFCKKLQLAESKNEQLMKKVNDEVEKNKQLMTIIDNEIEQKEILIQEFFDIMKNFKNFDNIDETVYDNIKHYIDNSLICSNNDIYKFNQFTCSKCNKQLTSKRNLINHESKCDGLFRFKTM